MGFVMVNSAPVGNAVAADVLDSATFSSAAAGSGVAGTMPNATGNLTPSGTGTVAIPVGYHDGDVVDQVTVPAADVLTGTTIAGVAGTMPNQGSPTYNPSTSAQAIAAGYYSGGTIAAATLGAQGSLSIGATAGVQTLTITGLGFAPTKVVVVPSVTSLAGGTGKSLIGEGTTANYAFSLYDSSQDAANVYVGGTAGSEIAATLSLVAGGFSIQLASGYTWGSTNGAATSDFTWYAIG